jgi:hypothetical protein
VPQTISISSTKRKRAIHRALIDAKKSRRDTREDRFVCYFYCVLHSLIDDIFSEDDDNKNDDDDDDDENDDEEDFKAPKFVFDPELLTRARSLLQSV